MNGRPFDKLRANGKLPVISEMLVYWGAAKEN